jgi:hypothetical protein
MRLKDKHPRTFPKMLAGGIYPEQVVCGKPGCRCQRGSKHGPYFVRIWRQNGERFKEYVRLEELEIVKSAIAAHQVAELNRRQRLEGSAQLFRSCSQYLRGQGL